MDTIETTLVSCTYIHIFFFIKKKLSGTEAKQDIIVVGLLFPSNLSSKPNSPSYYHYCDAKVTKPLSSRLTSVYGYQYPSNSTGSLVKSLNDIVSGFLESVRSFRGFSAGQPAKHWTPDDYFPNHSNPTQLPSSLHIPCLSQLQALAILLWASGIKRLLKTPFTHPLFPKNKVKTLFFHPE